MTNYILAKFHYTTFKSVWDILNTNEICQFSHLLTNPVTLILGQGQWNRYDIKDTMKYHIMAKFHHSKPKSVWDILNINEIVNVLIFERTLWPWFLVKVNDVGMLSKILWSIILWPSFITLYLKVSEISWISMKFVNFHIFERTLWPWLLIKVNEIGMVLKLL